LHNGEAGFGNTTPRNSDHLNNTNCDGNPVRVEADMRTRLVDQHVRYEWDALMIAHLIFIDVPSVSTMQSIYVKNTRVNYDCVKCS
jgi:hypothetical protein